MASRRPSMAHPTHERLLNAKQMHNGLKRICAFNQANNLPLPAQSELASAVLTTVGVPPSGGTSTLEPRPVAIVSKALGDFVAAATQAALPCAARSGNGGNGWTRLNAGFAFVLSENVLITNAITRRPPNLFQKLFPVRGRRLAVKPPPPWPDRNYLSPCSCKCFSSSRICRRAG
jgi:hypothetical protein